MMIKIRGIEWTIHFKFLIILHTIIGLLKVGQNKSIGKQNLHSENQKSKICSWSKQYFEEFSYELWNKSFIFKIKFFRSLLSFSISSKICFEEFLHKLWSSTLHYFPHLWQGKLHILSCILIIWALISFSSLILFSRSYKYKSKYI